MTCKENVGVLGRRAEGERGKGSRQRSRREKRSSFLDSGS